MTWADARRSAPVTARLLFVPALFGLLCSIGLLVHQHSTSGGIDGFPLDDPWIHLTYARNLHDHGSFAYFPGDAPTAGSTSPLYTLLLALGFTFTRDEKLLSYALGILFHVGFLLAMAAWARRRLGACLALAATALLALDPRIAILAVSGMETSLFLALVATAFWGLAARRPLIMGIALGLAVWTRPDALVLVGVVAIAAALAARAGGPAGAPADRVRAPGGGGAAGWRALTGRHPWLAWALPLVLLFAAYLVFNQATGHRWMPNTLAAKRAYYITTPKSVFLQRDVWATFGIPSFGVTAWLALLPFVLVSLVREARRLLRPVTADSVRAEIGFALALPLAYLLVLPFAHRFERYLIPALLPYAVAGMSGLRHVATSFVKPAARVAPTDPVAEFPWRSPAGVVGGAVLVLAIALQAMAFGRADRTYREIVGYHYQRHERTGRWLKDNTPPNAVIATHDVGAIAYYSERRVIDMVGLIQPDAIPHLHRPDYQEFLREFFAREQVTHLAVLRNWIEVSNVDPLFTADPRPEILEVFPWTPQTHLVAEPAAVLNQRASFEMSRGNAAGAVEHLQRSLQVDPESARTWMLLGAAYEVARNFPAAEAADREALKRHPTSPVYQARLASALANQQKRDEALALVNQVLATAPNTPGAAELKRALGY